MAASLFKSFIKKIIIQNYKSIGHCSVEMKPFSLLVGPNGTGKSNFLDAFRFVAEALRTTPEHALRERGGIGEVRRKSSGHPNNFGISMYLQLPNGQDAFFAFKIAASQNGGFIIQKESCRVNLGGIGSDHYFYQVEEGVLKDSSSENLPKKIEPDRLYLVLASALPEFNDVYTLLSHMGFYNLNPDRIRDLQDTDPGELLRRDGSNIVGVIRRLKSQEPEALTRIVEYLHSVVPGIKEIDLKSFGSKETLEFKQEISGGEHPWRFPATNMSDGTLRALGTLVAVFQAIKSGKNFVPLIGIEEPEAAIHPGAAVKLMDALLEGQRHIQLIITSHSPDLLNHNDIPADSILAVKNRGGETIIAPVDQASVTAIKDSLYTVGELLRLNQLEPDEDVYKSFRQAELFDFEQ
jgi:predicted ATPase